MSKFFFSILVFGLLVFVSCVITKSYCRIDEAKNEPFLGGHLIPELNLFDQILP